MSSEKTLITPLLKIMNSIMEIIDPEQNEQFVILTEKNIDKASLEILLKEGLLLRTQSESYKANLSGIVKKTLKIIEIMYDNDIKEPNEKKKLRDLSIEYSKQAAAIIHTFIDKHIINESLINILLNFEDLTHAIEELQGYKDQLTVAGYYVKLSDGTYKFNMSSDLIDVIEKCNVQIDYVSTLIEEYMNRVIEIEDALDKYPRSIKKIDDKHIQITLTDYVITKDHPYYAQYVMLLQENLDDIENAVKNKYVELQKNHEILQDIIPTLKEILITDDRFIEIVSDNMYANLIKLRDSHFTFLNKMETILEHVAEIKNTYN